MRHRVITEGWYKLLAVYSQSTSLPKARLFLPAGSLRTVNDKEGRCWYAIKYPDPTKGGIIWVRIRKVRIREAPCHCSLLRFPHRRAKRCTGEYHG